MQAGEGKYALPIIKSMYQKSFNTAQLQSSPNRALMQAGEGKQALPIIKSMYQKSGIAGFYSSLPGMLARKKKKVPPKKKPLNLFSASDLALLRRLN